MRGRCSSECLRRRYRGDSLSLNSQAPQAIIAEDSSLPMPEVTCDVGQQFISFDSNSQDSQSSSQTNRLNSRKVGRVHSASKSKCGCQTILPSRICLNLWITALMWTFEVGSKHRIGGAALGVRRTSAPDINALNTTRTTATILIPKNITNKKFFVGKGCLNLY